MARLWTLSRIAEEFHVTPSEAESLLLDDDDNRAIEILELRAYANAKRAYSDADGKLENLEKTELMNAVIDNDFALQRARLAKKKGSQ